ncbi:MAG TPA: DNA recombination protein RmuC [Chitinophagales bacterium]|nr:DNA recombination protein RmuC [Chitinophagales bacterium]
MEWIFVVIGLVLGLIIALVVLRKNTSLQKEIQQLTGDKSKYQTQANQLLESKNLLDSELKTIRTEFNQTEKTLVYSQQENSYLKDQLLNQKEELTQLQQRFKIEFEQLAQKILEEKSKKFTDQNEEKISALLLPLREKIIQFEQKVENVNKEQIDRNATLIEQIRQLGKLHAIMSTETQNLTKALKSDNKIQGNWGEVVLESILEKSGLRKGYEYFTQSSYQNEDGRQVRPDVIVQLPDNKHVVVDSKVSLVAYERCVNSEDDIEKQTFTKAHIASIRQHVKSLSQKEYHLLHQINSPDFVLLFIPIEPAFHIAIHEDRQLFQDAFDQNIIIVSTSTLLATLRTISSIWKQEYQNRHSQEIAQQAGRLYDKFVTFTDDLQKVGQRINQTQDSYQAAMNKLQTGNGNLIRSSQKLKELGVKTSKQLSPNLIENNEEEE